MQRRQSKYPNAIPEGWREISEKDFVQGPFFEKDPDFFEFRQFNPSPFVDTRGYPLVNARLWFFYDKTGVGMMDDHWAGKIRFFAFGCEHKWTHIRNEGRCLNIYRCDKCGYTEEIDSSD